MAENRVSFDDKLAELERLVVQLRDLSPYAIEEIADTYVRIVTLVRELKEGFKDAVGQLNSAGL